MPQLDEIVQKRQKKKFIKKSYRPWDLSGDSIENPSAENHENSTQTSSPDNQVNVNKQTTSISKENQLRPKAVQEKASNLDNNSGNNSATDQVTIREQLDNNKVTIREQLDNNPITDQVTIREQLDNNLDPNSLRNRIAKLSGLQRNILEFIVDICAAKNQTETGPIETIMISQFIQASYGSTKTSINRLIEKDFLKRQKGRTAKGGYINLAVPEKISHIVMSLRSKNSPHLNPVDLIQTIRKQLDNNIDNNSVYSSSSYINTTTTNEKTEITKLRPDWQKINFEPLTGIGFTKTQLKQLVDKNTADVVQESIYHFAYGLEHNPKTQEYKKNGKNPLNVLMGVLRKGQGWFENNYRSPQELAQEALLQQKQAEQERLKKMEEKAYKLALNEWQSNLIQSEHKQILNSYHSDQNQLMPEAVKLSLYFRDKIWPNIKASYLVKK